MSLHKLSLRCFVLQSDLEEQTELPAADLHGLKRSREASRSEDVVRLVEDELHRLVLVNHVHCHVAIIPLRAHQRRPEHDADVLGGHSVGV